MKSTLRFTAAVSFFGAALCGMAQEPPAPKVGDPTLEWIQQITLRPAFGGERSGTRRWMRAPTLSVMKASTEQANLVAEAVKDINESLAKTPIKGIVLSQPDNDKADILVYVAPLEQLPAHAKRHDLTFREGNVNSYGMVNQKYEMQRGYVLVASDKLSGDTLRAGSLWGIISALGFQQVSGIIADSVFAGRGNGISETDRKLIVFFYNHVPPMSEDRAIGKLYKEHWPK